MAQKEQIREQIVKEAGEIFSKFGYKKTTMDDIAQASRKGKSTLYYYFKSKEEVFEAVLEREVVHLRKRLRLTINSSEDPKEKLKNYVITRMTTIRQLVNLTGALKSEYFSNLEFVERIRRKYDLEEVDMIREILEYGIRRNYFQIQDIQLAALGIVTALRGIEPQLMTDNSKIDFGDRLQNIINILFYGIVKR